MYTTKNAHRACRDKNAQSCIPNVYIRYGLYTFVYIHAQALPLLKPHIRFKSVYRVHYILDLLWEQISMETGPSWLKLSAAPSMLQIMLENNHVPLGYKDIWVVPSDWPGQQGKVFIHCPQSCEWCLHGVRPAVRGSKRVMVWIIVCVNVLLACCGQIFYAVYGRGGAVSSIQNAVAV